MGQDEPLRQSASTVSPLTGADTGKVAGHDADRRNTPRVRHDDHRASGRRRAGDVVYQTARNMDFLQIHSPAVDALMFTRGLPERLARWLRRRPTHHHRRPCGWPTCSTARLIRMYSPAGWPSARARAGNSSSAPSERSGSPISTGRPSPPRNSAEFSEPDFAKIAAGFSVRPYGRSRTLSELRGPHRRHR